MQNYYLKQMCVCVLKKHNANQILTQTEQINTNTHNKSNEIINTNINIVNLEILKIKTWFGDKD